ncbi:uncharacterized protein LOC116801490 isoform X4 [Drosophila sechellia]|uniref:uncharacterized protein LOC116801490 isoform X4 n=1 Tax=Drosophila sechellia TaxID=7238 RepID=UPI0013DD9525|nr:uncharacterized protein LOC116801490 isoform X4 [Drosophila sechellia]
MQKQRPSDEGSCPGLITHRPLQGPWSEDLTRRQLHQFQFFDGLVDGYSGHSSASSRVCVCVFMTFVDYAYKNYTSPRSQRSGHQLQQRIAPLHNRTSSGNCS